MLHARVRSQLAAQPAGRTWHVHTPHARGHRCEVPGPRLNVAVLLSGGVDSSLALRLLLAAGHHCKAFYLQIWFQVGTPAPPGCSPTHARTAPAVTRPRSACALLPLFHTEGR